LVAVKHQLWDTCQAILDSGTPVLTPVVVGALQKAAAAGQEQLVARLIEAAGDALIGIHEQSWEGRVLKKALSAASRGGHHRVCHLLGQLIPQAYKELHQENPPLELVRKAAASGNIEEVCSLVDSWRQRHPTEQKGLHQMEHAALAAAAGQGQLEVIRALVGRGADVNGGKSYFHIESPLERAIKNKRLEAVQFLLEQGAAVHGIDGGYTLSALGYAARVSDVDICRQLLSRQGVVVGSQELLEAVRSGQLSIVELLLDSEDYMHPELRQDQITREVCMYGAVADALGYIIEDDRPEGASLDTCYVGVLRKLLNPPAHWGPITPAMLDSGVRAAHKALSEDEDANESFVLAIKVLAEVGADFAINQGAFLIAAAEGEHDEILETILRVSPGIASAYGMALFQASERPELAALLMQAGAPLEQEPGMYEQLLRSAIGEECDDLLDLLIS
jgi:ankyrin repeat protein